MKKYLVATFLFLLFVFLLSSCVPGDGYATVDRPANFLWGIWHGWVAPVSLIIGLFNNKIGIYETFNTGWWYDFGFYLAIVGGFGGLSFFRRSRRKYPDRGSRRH